MARLLNSTKNQILAEEVIEAKSFFHRAKGLLGVKEFQKHKTLWIHNCNSIHTWFMNFKIDAIFVDKNLKVVSTSYNLKPWRIVLPRWRARSVFEFATASAPRAEKGDQLYVEA